MPSCSAVQWVCMVWEVPWGQPAGVSIGSPHDFFPTHRPASTHLAWRVGQHQDVSQHGARGSVVTPLESFLSGEKLVLQLISPILGSHGSEVSLVAREPIPIYLVTCWDIIWAFLKSRGDITEGVQTNPWFQNSKTTQIFLKMDMWVSQAVLWDKAKKPCGKLCFPKMDTTPSLFPRAIPMVIIWHSSFWEMGSMFPWAG